jgi:hypothetical protein
MGSGFGKAIYLTFTRRSYNYSLHNLTPHELKTLSSLSCILAPGYFLVIPSPAVFCLSAVSQYLYSFCTGPRPVLSCLLTDECLLVLQSSSNPLKVPLGVPSRGHSVEQLIFSCCHSNVSLVAVGTKVYLAVDWQWTFILNAWGTCLSRVAQQTDRYNWSSHKRLNNPLPRN